MEIKNKIFYIKLFGIFSILICILITGYVIHLRKIIEHNIITSIDETVLHDKHSIRTCLEFFIDDLNGIAKRLSLDKCETIQDLKTRLNYENASTRFTDLYVMAEDGRLYTDRFLVLDPHKSTFAAQIHEFPFFSDDSTEIIVSKFDNNKENLTGMLRESILYSVRLDNCTIDGIKMIALIGITDINFLQKHMLINSFIINEKPCGYSSLIDYDGNYIVGHDKNIHLNDSGNFFQKLESSKKSTLKKEDIIQKMNNAETFSFHVSDQKESLIYFAPFDSKGNEYINWYLVMDLDNDVLLEQQFTFTLMSLILLAFVVLTMIAMAFYALSNHNKLFKAHEAIKVRTEFLSNMSHEIRTPLNGLIGLNYLISTSIDDKNRLPQIKDWLNKSKSLADYLLSLLNDILDMAKLQAGKIDIASAPFSVEHMLEDIWIMQRDTIEQKGVLFAIEKEVLAPWIQGDEMRTKQVLVNIIGNAAKFTPRGGKITLSVSQCRVGDARVITSYRCSDSGIGMSKAFLEKIFDPFVQERNAQSATALKGTGLGIPISKELVDAMGGDISVESTLGQGSVFTVTLPSPIAQEPPKIEAAPAPQERAKRRDGKPIKILLAEDAEFNAEFLIEVLQDEGFEVVHAENGQVTVETFQASAVGEFDIILMDMQMPVMDGCEAAQTIRKLDRPDAGTVTIFACTANTFKEDMDRALQSGMNDFLTKPVDIKAFLEKLRNQGTQARA